MECQHCYRSLVIASKGLCWSCYKFHGFKYRGRRERSRSLPSPTLWSPGTVEKLKVLSKRRELRQRLHHPADNREQGTGTPLSVPGVPDHVEPGIREVSLWMS